MRTDPGIEWHRAPAEALPLDSSSFDAVVSQFGLMYFEDRPAALREMRRVVRPGGRVAVAVWAALDELPGYATLVNLLQRLFGDQIAAAKRAPFVLGDRALLRALFDNAGIANAQISTQQATARFPSIESWVHTEIRGWTLADVLDDVQFDLLLREAEGAMRPYVADDSAIIFKMSAHIVTATG